MAEGLEVEVALAVVLGSILHQKEEEKQNLLLSSSGSPEKGWYIGVILEKF